MPVRGIRCATTCDANSQSVLDATSELLQAILVANPGLRTAEIASAWFTVTPDLQVVHPARAARDLGWTDVPLMCGLEIDVSGSLPRCIRVLIHWNTDLPQSSIKHVYLREAVKLRPDLVHEN